MSISSFYTRNEWVGWEQVKPYVDDVILLWREEDNPEDDVAPRTVRVDPNNGYQPWPEDSEPSPAIPFRHYTREEEGWVLFDEGVCADVSVNLITLPREASA